MSSTFADGTALVDLPTRVGGDANLEVSPPDGKAAGVTGVYWALRMALPSAGPVRGARALAKLNQFSGYDCSGCAWPDPQDRSVAEFCENGAKAVAEEATSDVISPTFFERNTLDFLSQQSDYWLGRQGRLAHPVIKRAGSDTYEPITWDDAYAMIAGKLSGLKSPDEAVFYTSGRTSNEAAYAYQLMARMLGTNNLPDCSNMCHESSGSALNATIGIGKGTVQLADIECADLIIIAGQNPGTNHPRMMTSLEKQKQAGGKIVAINPLPEAGLGQFRNPQTVRGVLGEGTQLTDVYVPIRVRGDHAFFMGVVAELLKLAEDRPEVLDTDFINAKTTGFDDLKRAATQIDWDDIEYATGVARSYITQVAQMIADAKSVIICWAMGLTQHADSVAAIQEIVNVLLMTGNFGKPGAGACPVRGHSNVQGDRTMGIWEVAKPAFMDALEREFGFSPPRDMGYDVVNTIHAAARGDVEFFMAMGGNFVRATPDTVATERAMSAIPMTVHVSTKLNGSHVRIDRDATSIILPTLVRSEVDTQPAGVQRVTVEDSMGVVHASTGVLEPISDHLHSEVRIVANIAKRLPQRGSIDWEAFANDYRVIRRHVSRTIDGFDDFERKIDEPGGFALPNPPQDDRSFATDDERAHFSVNSLDVLRVPKGRLILQTLRSHDQYNTTIYGMDDRYRGIKAGRRVVFCNEADIADAGLQDGQMVDITSYWPDEDGGEETRVAEAFRVVTYPIAKGCAAAYFPETNVLVPLGSVARTSNTPTSKSVIVTLAPTMRRGVMPIT